MEGWWHGTILVSGCEWTLPPEKQTREEAEAVVADFVHQMNEKYSFYIPSSIVEE